MVFWRSLLTVVVAVGDYKSNLQSFLLRCSTRPYE